MNWSNSARSLATRRRFREFLELALLVFETAQHLSAIVVESTIAA